MNQSHASNHPLNTIAQGTRLKGEVKFEEDVLIDGHVEGSIQVNGKLIVGENARIEADIEASEVEIHGAVEGAVRSSGRLSVQATGRIVGDITTQQLSVQEGAQLEGKINMASAGPSARAKSAEPTADAA